MKAEELATIVIDACETAGVEYMLTGAFAHGFYGIPRATNDVDVVLSLTYSEGLGNVVRALEGKVVFDPQWQFDTLTWGRRLVGTALDHPGLKVELFELFNDDFVQAQFSRRRQLFSAQVNRMTWLPSPEDVIVQKIRWGRGKDLDDARDVLAVQEPRTLDMTYIERWCTHHGHMDRLKKLLEEVAGI